MSNTYSSDEMFNLIRSFGYTTRNQTDEIVDAILSQWGTPQPARELFDAGWKACARFCDREDVIFDGIIGSTGCPAFEQAFKSVLKQSENT